MDLSFIRNNLRSFLRIPENVSPSVSASLPTASLGGTPPELSFTRPAPVAPVAPVATAAPRFRKAPVDGEGFTAYQRKMQYEARLKTEFGLHEKLEAAGMKSEARRKVLGDFDRFVAARPLAKATPPPATDDDGTPVQTASRDDSENPAGIDSILSQLLDLLTELKKQVQSSPSDDDEATAALGHFAAGRKLTASRGLMALTQKLCQRPKLTSTQKISRGFSEQDGVQAIQACLRPGPRTVPATGTAPAVPTSTAVVRPLSPSAKIARGFNAQPQISALNGFLHRSPTVTPPASSVPPAAPSAAASPAGSRERALAIRAEIAQIDKDQRRLGFTNERNAKHAQLSAQLRAEMKRLRPQ